jgi:hypothetical protein
MTKKTNHKELNPVEITILPIANELSEFAKTMPPDLTKWNNLHFENLYSRLDIQLVRFWLDESGFSDAAKKFETDLNQFLIRFRKWEYQLRRSGIIKTEQLIELRDIDENLFWELKSELDEIYDTAEQIAKWLKKLADIIKQKFNQKKSDNSRKEQIQPEYTFPLSMKKWAAIFQVSENTMSKLKESEKYHFDKISERKWRLPKHEIPIEYLEMYRQTIMTKQNKPQ